MSDINTIIERINNLMAIAENEASSDNEAQMAFERARKLINEYRIEDWKRDRTRTNKPIIERGVNVSKTTIYHQQGYLATIIAQANECRAYLHESRCGGRIEERAVMFVGEEDDVNAAVILFQSIDLYCSVHARTSYADMIDQHAKAYYEDNKEYVETHYGHESYPTLTECKQYMRRDYPRAKFYYGYRGGFNERLSERFEELRKQSLDIPSGRELVARKSQRVNDYFDNLELEAARVATARGSKAGFVCGVSDANNVGLGLSEMGVSSHALLNA